MDKAGVNSVRIGFPGFGARPVFSLFCFLVVLFCVIFACYLSFAEEVKQPNVSGRFYPANPKRLSGLIEGFLLDAGQLDIKGDVLVIISPHAGYEFSGRTAAFGYKAVQGKDYDTVIILGPSHYSHFKGAALYKGGGFLTPLGKIPVNASLNRSLMLNSALFSSSAEAFSREHSIEVQLPFLQTVFDNFKIVPIVLGSVDFKDCQDLAVAIAKAVKGSRCLIIASSDMYHGLNYQECELKDAYTLSLIRQLKPQKLFQSVQNNEAQLCGWAGVIISMLVAQNLGYEQVYVADYTNSLKVMNRQTMGEYCVGYSSVIIYKQNDKGGRAMLNEAQRKRLLKIARDSISHYLKTSKKMSVNEDDPALLERCGAFVTLHQNERLRGCIGNIIGQQPLYLTVRDMAVEAAVGDPRFMPVSEEELSGIEIEVSVLSPLEKIDNPGKIQMGEHGVLIKRGFRSGVFLPQVAIETGWSRDEFLSNLCSHKAGLDPLAWKDPATEIYIFSAEVFSE